MKIKVDLFYRIRDLAPERFRHGPTDVELSAGAKVVDLLNLINVAPSTPMVLLVDGRARKLSDKLPEGGVVTIFPPLDGG